MRGALPLVLFWLFLGLIWVANTSVPLRRPVTAKSFMEAALAKHFPSLYFSWFSQRKCFMIPVAYEQKIYNMLINNQFQVASHGWGCLCFVCP